MKTMRWLVMSLILISLVFSPANLGFVLAQDGDTLQEDNDEAKNPVVVFLAGLTDKDPAEIEAYQEEGYGLGEIAKAYYLTKIVSEMEAGEITLPEGYDPTNLDSLLGIARNTGWGNIYKELGLHPGDQRGLGWLFKEEGRKGEKIGKDNENTQKPEWVGPPDHANNDKDKDTSPPDHANDDKDKVKDDKDKD